VRLASHLSLDLRRAGDASVVCARPVIEEQQRAAAGSYRFAVVCGPRKVQRLFEIAGFAADDELFVESPTRFAGGGD
jgi:hypothetical protein